jgi:hypothetical protein
MIPKLGFDMLRRLLEAIETDDHRISWIALEGYFSHPYRNKTLTCYIVHTEAVNASGLQTLSITVCNYASHVTSEIALVVQARS